MYNVAITGLSMQQVDSKVGLNVVNRGKWFMQLCKLQRSKQNVKIYVGRSATVHNLLFCANTLCMNYVTETSLLVTVLAQTEGNFYCVLCTVKVKESNKYI